MAVYTNIYGCIVHSVAFGGVKRKSLSALILSDLYLASAYDWLMLYPIYSSRLRSYCINLLFISICLSDLMQVNQTEGYPFLLSEPEQSKLPGLKPNQTCQSVFFFSFERINLYTAEVNRRKVSHL